MVMTMMLMIVFSAKALESQVPEDTQKDSGANENATTENVTTVDSTKSGGT